MLSPEEMRQRSEMRVSERKKKISEAMVAYIETIPAGKQGLAYKVYSGDASAREAVKLKCHECQAFENAVLQIETCEVHTCPLHHHRPHK